MVKRLRAKLLRLALAASLIMPAFGALNMVEAHASCYYQGYTDTVYGSYGATTFSSTAEYTVGYSCSGVPQEINLGHIRDVATFAKCVNFCMYPVHKSTEGDWCNGYQNYYCRIAWYAIWTTQCSSQYGSCIVTRNEYPNQWKTYTWYSASSTSWSNFNSGGGDDACKIIHSFIRHIWELPCAI